MALNTAVRSTTGVMAAASCSAAPTIAILMTMKMRPETAVVTKVATAVMGTLTEPFLEATPTMPAMSMAATPSAAKSMKGEVVVSWMTAAEMRPMTRAWPMLGRTTRIVRQKAEMMNSGLIMPPEMDEVPGGKEKIAQELAALGPMKADEKKLMFISVVLFFFWATEKIVHPFDTSSTTIVAVTLMMMPGIGIMTWKEVQERINWGTLLLFGVGISLGSAILSTKAGEWIAHVIVEYFGLYDATATFIIAILALFLILIHLGFASATALSSAMIPICISVLQGASENMTLNVVGMVMILQYTICFGFILPVNAPQNMIAYSTDTFEVKDFIKTGIPLTIFAYLTILLLTNTYWKWLGLVL